MAGGMGELFPNAPKIGKINLVTGGGSKITDPLGIFKVSKPPEVAPVQNPYTPPKETETDPVVQRERLRVSSASSKLLEDEALLASSNASKKLLGNA